MKYEDIEAKVLQWGFDRQITINGTAMGQAIKTAEEANELLAAINKKSVVEAKDAIGDILVTLVMCASIMGLDVVECFDSAYGEIKDRTGFLGKDGIFYKDAK